MENLINRLRHMGVMLLIGFLLIIYIAFSFVYWQQGGQQKELNEQIANLSLVLARPLGSSKELQAEYEKVNKALAIAPRTNKDAIIILVGIAKKSGIDIEEGSDKFRVFPATFGQTKVGGGSYQVLSFTNIRVQGDYDNVMAFIADLDSGKTLETMVLKRVDTNQIEVKGAGEEETKTETEAILDVDIYTKP